MAAQETASLKDKRILVVEDHYLIATDLSRALSKLGGVIAGPFGNVAAARAELAKSDVHYAFLDVDLGEEMVFPLADELERREIPFVFATGHDGTIVPERFRSKPRLEKPFTAQSIAEIVRRLTGA